ncbi:MAG: hypothetical protein QXH30_03490, partial [Candidatus Bilamarchaeaceae archaeon]
TQGGPLGGTSGGAGTSGGTSGGAGASSGGTQGGNDPFANWDFAAMTAMGQPVYCEVTYAEAGFSCTYKMYIKGENMRVDATSFSGGEETASTTIIKGKKVYMQYSEPAEMGNGAECQWTYMDLNRIEACMPENAKAESSTDIGKYEEPPANYHCQYGNFGDEKFATPSIPTSCDLSEQLCQAYEAMQKMGGSGYANPMAACEGLQGDELQACLEAQFGG